MSASPNNAESVASIVSATGRHSIEDALAWLAEGHPMPPDTDWQRLLAALVAIASEDKDVHDRALRRVTREATSSRLDTSRILFNADKIPSPAEFKGALDELIARSSDGTLGGLTPRGVLRAQYHNERAIETLCYVAGVAHSDAKQWFAPRGGKWTEDRIQELLSYLDELVEGRFAEPAPNMEPARAIELRDGGGWSRLDALRTNGVPYEILLTQRAVGGTWLRHKNQTSQRANIVAANMVCWMLEARGIAFRRSTTVGGEDKQSDLQVLAGVSDKRVGIVVLDSEERVAFCIAFSTANNGGTARANGDGLLGIPLTDLPFALMLSGQGWASRPETDKLARRFGGRLFTEYTIDRLIDCIEAVIQ